MMFLDVINRMIQYAITSGPKGAHLFFMYRRMCLLFKSVILEEAGIEPRTSQT